MPMTWPVKNSTASSCFPPPRRPASNVGSPVRSRDRPAHACHDDEMTTPGPPAQPDGAVAGFPVTPPPLPGPVAVAQRCTDLPFVHWPVQPDSVAGMYPPGTRPDVFADGMTYVALVPFA